MESRLKISLVAIFFTLLNTAMYANPIDTVAVDYYRSILEAHS